MYCTVYIISSLREDYVHQLCCIRKIKVGLTKIYDKIHVGHMSDGAFQTSVKSLEKLTFRISEKIIKTVIA